MLLGAFYQTDGSIFHSPGCQQALGYLCFAATLRGLACVSCIVENDLPFGGMVPRKWIYDFMILLGTERSMGDANDGNLTRVFCLAGIDHSKGRGCRVMFPEVVGQFTVKYTVKGPIRRYSDTMYCMFTDVACFNSHKKTNALHSIFVCVCVSLAPQLLGEIRWGRLLQHWRDSVKLRRHVHAEQCLLILSFYPGCMQNQKDHMPTQPGVNEYILHISSCIFNKGFACHLWFGCNMQQQRWPTSNWKVYTCWCRAELARALLII